MTTVQELTASSINSKAVRGDVLVAVERATAAAGWMEWRERETCRDSITSQLRFVSNYLCSQQGYKLVAAIQVKMTLYTPFGTAFDFV